MAKKGANLDFESVPATPSVLLDSEVSRRKELTKAHDGNRYALSEKRLLALAATKINPSLPAHLRTMIRVTAAEFGEALAIDKENRAVELRNAVEALMERKLEWRDGEGNYGWSRWISGGRYALDGSFVELLIVPEVAEQMVQKLKSLTNPVRATTLPRPADNHPATESLLSELRTATVSASEAIDRALLEIDASNERIDTTERAAKPPAKK